MRTAEGNEPRLDNRKEAISDGITTQEMAQSRIHRMRWWTLAVVSVTVVLATIDETILNVAIPSLQRDLGASASSLQWMINAYVLVFGGQLPIDAIIPNQIWTPGDVPLFALSTLPPPPITLP